MGMQEGESVTIVKGKHDLNDVIPGELQVFYNRFCVGNDIPMGDHHPLGLTCGPRSKDDLGQAIRVKAIMIKLILVKPHISAFKFTVIVNHLFNISHLPPSI